MNRKICTLSTATVLMLCACAGCAKKESAPVTVDPAQLELFGILPEVMDSAANPVTDEKVVLGRMLYYEPRLSNSQQISCNSCHMLDKYGVDGQPTSDGHMGKLGDRNSPTVYNAAGHLVQFWDGRAESVEEQAKGPVMNPVEMAMPAESVVIEVLESMPEYVEAFRKAFPEEKDPITFDNMARAVGAFERKLVTPSRWDLFLQGDSTALTNEEKAGFNTFVDVGCQTCHAGTYVGGNLFQKLGLTKPWPDTSDTGRQRVTGSAADRMVFKVPSLRNIEKTAPYYHNGKVATLDEAISTMADYQLGRTLSGEQVKSIAAWLRSLTGELPSAYIEQPQLPKSTARTPKPDVSD